MRKCFLIPAIFLCLLQTGCRQTSEREAIIEELHEFCKAVTVGDKEKVAGYFTFPIHDEALQLKLEHSGEPEITIDTFDKNTFIQHYQRIISGELKDLFKELDIYKLQTTDILNKEVVPAGRADKCYHTYEMSLSKKEVTLTMYTNTRNDIALADDDFCQEYAEFWTFELENGHLVFKKFNAAG